MRQKIKLQWDTPSEHKLNTTRKAHIYCVGTAKSGTHSIDQLFSGSFKTVHEVEPLQTITLISYLSNGLLEVDELKEFLKDRDKHLGLDIDSSQLNFFFLDYFLDIFPESRFILTVRDPYSWLESIISHRLAMTVRPDIVQAWESMNHIRFRPELYHFPLQEKILQDSNLFPLDGYLSYWVAHNIKVLETVPEDRLLVLPTNRISERLKETCDFVGCPIEEVNKSRSQSFKNPVKSDILQQVDREYIIKKLDRHCNHLIDRAAQFPQLASEEWIINWEQKEFVK